MNLPTKQADGSGRFYEYVIDNIRQMIADGELQAGQKLPSERELAEKFNVSRVPIREALKILEYMGVLDSSPGDGTYVKNTSAQSLVSKMNFSFDATADTIRDLLELRIVLETFAAYHAAQRRTDEDIASIQKLLRDMREAKKVNDGTEESVQNLRKLSHGFHQALVRAAHNAVLSSVYEYLYAGHLPAVHHQQQRHLVQLHCGPRGPVQQGHRGGCGGGAPVHGGAHGGCALQPQIHHGNRSPGTEGRVRLNPEQTRIKKR